MPLTPTDYRENNEEVSRKNSELSNKEIAGKFRGLKREEYIIREAYRSILPKDFHPNRLMTSSEMTEYNGDNAYALHDEWEVLMPVDGTERQSRLEVLGEEIAHNIDHEMRENLDLDASNERIYREFMANALADHIFDGRNERHVRRYRDVNSQIEEFYNGERVAEDIQNDIPDILEILEPTIEEAREVEWSIELGQKYEEALRSNITVEGLRVEKVNESGEVEIRSPTLDYEDHHIGDYRDWLSGDIRAHEDPETVIDEMKKDKELGPQEFAEKYGSLIESIKARARDRAGFDCAHIVGRELWHRLESEGVGIEEILRLSNEEVEGLIEQRAPIIKDEYGLNHQTFQTTSSSRIL